MVLRSVLGHVGVMAHLGAALGHFEAILRHLGVFVGPFWAILGFFGSRHRLAIPFPPLSGPQQGAISGHLAATSGAKMAWLASGWLQDGQVGLNMG
jgi:hypothetical protein